MPWPTAAIGEIAEIVSGATPKTGVADYWDGDIAWATPADLSALSCPYIADTPRKITAAGLATCAARVLPVGSVLLSSRAPIGHVAINARPMATNQGFKSLVPREGVADAKYLYHWLVANKSYLQSLGNGATFKEISKAVVSKVRVPLPQIEEQRRIADILDRADALRAKRREALALLDVLTQSIFLDMFGDPVLNPKGWERMPLTQLLSKIDSGQSPVCLDRPAVTDEWAVLKLGAVTSGTYIADENKALPPGAPCQAKHEVQAGDVLFSRKNTRELVAASAYVWETPPRRLLPDLIFRLRVADRGRVVPLFLQQLISFPSQRRKIQELASGSAASMPNISKARLGEVRLVAPPIDLQREFAGMIASVRIVVMNQTAAGHTDGELFASLQQRAFAGEL